ncbi:MAG: IclR family transcriptional regulator, partial [Pseudorhodoplanes sp.]
MKRAIEVIELLAKCEDANGMSIRELSERLGIPAPSVHHCVKTFKEQGWVTQDSSKRYKVSSRLWQLGAAAIRHRDIVSLARPAMLELLRESDETVYLGQKEDEQLKNIIYLERLDSPRAIQVRYEIGTKVPSYCSAI